MSEYRNKLLWTCVALCLTGFVSVQARLIGLTADNDTSDAGGYGSSVAALLTDPFAYNIDDPTAAVPNNTDIASLYTVNFPEGSSVTVNFTLSEGAYTVATGGESLIIDLYGRSVPDRSRDDDIDVVLYNGDYSTAVATVTGLAVDDTSLHTRGTIALAEGLQFDRVQIIGHDSGAVKNYFGLAELRVSAVPEPATIGITSGIMDGSGDFVVTVDVSTVLPGTTLYLKRSENLVLDPITNIVDSVEVVTSTAMLTDTNAPAGQAFYQVTD